MPTNTDRLYYEDCLEILKRLKDNSIDAIVTDPPYNLVSINKRFKSPRSRNTPAMNTKEGSVWARKAKGFMGKEWDGTGIAFNLELWRECLRVIKPGGNLLSFGGTRTYHRMVCAIEDAGFEIRDCIMWVYGSGFPKSLDISKAVDKKAGAKREIIGKSDRHGGGSSDIFPERGNDPVTAPATPEAKLWEGYGTGLKPAYEPVVLAMKPLDGTFAENCLKWGVGGLNIDQCRITHSDPAKTTIRTAPRYSGRTMANGKVGGIQSYVASASQQGRFPANFLHDGSQEVMELFPETIQVDKRQHKIAHQPPGKHGIYGEYNGTDSTPAYGDSGSAARFFYCAKSSRRERNIGLDNKVTIKYNIPSGGVLCKDEFMVAVLLLQKVISGLTAHWNKDEFGENITAQFPRGISSTILTETNKITELKILPSLMHSLTNEYTQDVDGLTENGGNLAESVVSLREYLLIITKGNQELALGASRVVSEMLLRISAKENWEENYNFHATVKPLALMEYLVKLVTRPGHIVLDPFIGSGTTAIAAINTNRHYIGCELDKGYYDIAIKRIVQADKSKGLWFKDYGAPIERNPRWCDLLREASEAEAEQETMRNG